MIKREGHGDDSFSLILLGTETKFTLKEMNDTNYPQGESLSVAATQIKTDPEQIEQKDKEGISALIKNEFEIINGPDTLGTEVGDRIGRGLASLLKAISRGQTELNILGHSRGAVQAIIIAHELNEIQKIIENCVSLDKLWPYLKKQQGERIKNNTSNTNDFISTLKKKLKKYSNQDEFFKNLKINILKSSLNFFLMDPVPGDVYPITWFDERFYTLPSLVKNAEIIYYENERSDWGFTPIYIDGTDSNQKLTLLSMPGHHGTGSSGNNKSQQGYDVQPENQKATHVQKLIIYKILHFLQQQGVRLKENLDIFKKDLKLGSKYTDFFKKGDFHHIYRSLYSKIQENSKKYLAFNNTNYPYMGLLEYRRLLKKGAYEKYHHTFFSNHGFVNEEHLQLMMDGFFKLLGVDAIEINNLDQVVKKVRELLINSINTFAEETQKNTLNSKSLLFSEQIRQDVLNVYGALISQISQKYLMVDWTSEDQQQIKIQLFAEIKEMLLLFKTLSNENQKNDDIKEFVLALSKKSKSELSNTIEEQAQDLKCDIEHVLNFYPEMELEHFFTRIYLQLTQKTDTSVNTIFQSKELMQIKNKSLDDKIEYIWNQLKDHIAKEKSEGVSIKELVALYKKQFSQKPEAYDLISRRLHLFIEDVKALSQLEDVELKERVTFEKYEQILKEKSVTQNNNTENKLSFLQVLKIENLDYQLQLNNLKKTSETNNTVLN